MLIDSKLIFSNDQVVCNAGSEASDYEIDTGEADANLGAGTPLVARFIVTTVFDAVTSITISIQDSAAGSSYADLIVSRALVLAELAVGFTMELYLPKHHHRFLQAYYTLGGSNNVAGTMFGYLDMAG
jgi:hypothetical protein